MTTILIISFSNLSTDPRVSRQIAFLKDNYDLITIGFGKPRCPIVKHFPARGNAFKSRYRQAIAAALILSRQYESYYWQKNDIIHCLSLMNKLEFDLVIANDIDALPLAIRGAKDKKVIFDAHEYAPLEFEDRLSFRLLRQGLVTYLCNKYIPKTDGMMTVCNSISRIFENDTGIASIVVTNSSEYIDISPEIQEDNSSKIRLVHHGGASPSRKIENMINMMGFLDDRFELHLILVEGVKSYIKKLETMARSRSNIFFHEPVPMNEISDFLNKNFDIGVYILEPNSFNNKYALPNKLFEFIQARLAIAIAPSPEMAEIVRDYDLGIVATDFSPQALARLLNNLNHHQINYYKNKSHKAAQVLSANQNRKKILTLVKKTLSE
jgi:glycosyltransferase involved in cell wall biosynthesis